MSDLDKDEQKSGVPTRDDTKAAKKEYAASWVAVVGTIIGGSVLWWLAAVLIAQPLVGSDGSNAIASLVGVILLIAAFPASWKIMELVMKSLEDDD